jgi:hypothetical protein
MQPTREEATREQTTRLPQHIFSSGGTGPTQSLAAIQIVSCKGARTCKGASSTTKVDYTTSPCAGQTQLLAKAQLSNLHCFRVVLLQPALLLSQQAVSVTQGCECVHAETSSALPHLCGRAPLVVWARPGNTGVLERLNFPPDVSRGYACVNAYIMSG